MKCLAIKIFARIFLQLPVIYNCNSTHSYNRNIWVDIPSYISILSDRQWNQILFNLTILTLSSTEIFFSVWQSEILWPSKHNQHFTIWVCRPFGNEYVANISCRVLSVLFCYSLISFSMIDASGLNASCVLVSSHLYKINKFMLFSL